MYMMPTRNYIDRNLRIHHPRANVKGGTSKVMRKKATKSDHVNRVTEDLKRLGATHIELMSSESSYLPKIIHHKEIIGGIAYGHHEVGYCMLVATNRRVIFLDKKPFFANVDDITYDVVSGVSFGTAGFGSTLTLHTRIKDIKLMTMNDNSAKIFVDYVQLRCLEHEKKNGNGIKSSKDSSL